VVRCDSHERKSLERLCRYITRPACRQRTGTVQRRRQSGADTEDVSAPNANLRAQVVSKPTREVAPIGQADVSEQSGTHRPVRPGWLRLLKRILDLNLTHCPNCGGELTIIAALLERPGPCTLNRAEPKTPANRARFDGKPGKLNPTGVQTRSSAAVLSESPVKFA
jgi:hypothetical protein